MSAPTDEIRSVAREEAATVRSIQLAWNPRPGAEERAALLRTIRVNPDGRLDEGFTTLAKAAFDFGELFLASELADAGLVEARKLSPGPAVDDLVVRLTHLRALCAAALGELGKAQTLLDDALLRAPTNIDLLAVKGRIAKERAWLATDEKTARTWFARSRRAYERARRLARTAGDRSYLGINAAAVALWAGDVAVAEAAAREVLTILKGVGHDEWSALTIAEAELILGRRDAALGEYAAARQTLGPARKWRALHAARRHARRHALALGLGLEEIESVFAFPAMIVFSGHMVDAANRAPVRFPARLGAEAGARLERELRRLNPGFVFVSAAAGGDILCLEALERMTDLQPERHILLPWRKEDFIETSVAGLPGEDWEGRFHHALEEATTVSYLSQQTKPLTAADAPALIFEHLNRCLIGNALLRAKLLDLRVIPVALWDGEPGLPGGTGSFVESWRSLGFAVEHVPVPEIESIEVEVPAPAAPVRHRAAPLNMSVRAGRPTIQTMLFADVVGYSKIPEHQLAHFAPEFLGLASELLNQSADRPIFTNTWGDAFYFVFDEAAQAGRFGLALSERIQATDWASKGLPKELNLRIALHTGPVLMCVDPIIRQITFTGSHVSHAARIEPVVAPGEVWASESFAAHIAMAEASKFDPEPAGFALDYLGQVDFAKHYGRYPLFRVRRG